MISQKISKSLAAPEMSLKNAMKALSSGSGRVLFITDSNNRLVASVMDGDVRRGILNGISFDSPISKIMFKSPRFVRRSEKGFENKAERYIQEEELYAVPVLDEMNKVVDILFWHDFMEKHPLDTHIIEPLDNLVVIMAGGKGTRLDPFTKILPKPLIPIGDKPVIEKIMDNFHNYGFKEFILTLNYKKEMIKMYFKENQTPYNVEWIEEDEYLGTAGSLGLLKNRIKETFFVCNCDTILESNFNHILLWHKGEKALCTLIGCHKEMLIPYGTLEINGGYLKAINEKPKYDMIINTGVYIMEPEVLNYIPEGKPMNMDLLLKKLMQRGKVTVFPICEGWFDLGQWKEYKESLYLLQGRE